MLLTALAAVFRQEADFAFEVIVVDNASQDDSAAAVARDFPQVLLHRAPSNLGFAKANNLALTMARGRYLLLLNPDTCLHQGALAAALRRIADDPTIGILGIKQLEADGSLQPSWGNAPSLATLLCNALGSALCRLGLASLVPPLFRAFGLYLAPVRALASLAHASKECEAGWIMGAFLLMPLPLARQLGLFDERFTMYGEDMDLGTRVRQAGYRVVYFPQAAMTHWGGASSDKYRAEADAAHFLATIRYYQKHHGLWQRSLYRFILAAAASCGWILAGRNAEKRRGYFLKVRIALSPSSWRWP